MLNSSRFSSRGQVDGVVDSGSGTGVNGDDARNKEEILLKGLRYHCIFCLQNIGNADQTRTRTKMDTQFLKSFNEVWQYLKDFKCRAVNLKGECTEIMTFSNVPPICEGCVNLTEIVSSMLKALKLCGEEMKRKIREARKGGENQWRFESFEKSLRESTDLVNGRHISFVLKFIETVDPISQDQVEQEENENQVEREEAPVPVKRPRRSIRISKRSDPPEPVGPPECTGDKDAKSLSNRSVEETLVSPTDKIKKTVYVTILKTEKDDDRKKEASTMEYQPESIEVQESNINEDDDCQAENVSGDMDYCPSEDETGDEDDDGPGPCSSFPKTERISKVPTPKSLKDSSRKTKTHEIIICEVKGCGKSCLGRKGYTCHKNIVHPETVTEKFPCSCGEDFLTKRRLMIHMKKNLATHPEYYSDLCKRKYICDVCGVAMANEELLEHLKGHIGEEYIVKCPVDKCRYVFTNNDALLSHLYKMNCKSHPTGNISRAFMLNCDACGYTAKNRVGLRGHVAINHERVAESEKKIQCPVDGCDKLFNVKQSVDLHLSKHTYLKSGTEKMCGNQDQNIKGFLCEQCGSTCSSEKALLEHLFEHRDLKCLYCFICKDQVKYVRHFDLREHFSKVHQIECNEIICEECSESFWSKSYFRKHKEKHHSKLSEDHEHMEFEKKQTKKRYKCTDCPVERDVGFATESGLISHKINMHGADPFRCNECDDTFSNADAFTRHQKEHAGIVIKKWICEVEGCGRAFRKRTSLAYHKVAIHGEGGKRERTVVCDACGKTFYNAKSLRVHHQGVHLGVKRFVCDECGDKFFQRTSLMYHMRRHSGERPFACPVCDQRFRYKDVLTRHVEGHEKKGAGFKPTGPMKVVRKRKAE